jgi:hypothetical protein
MKDLEFRLSARFLRRLSVAALIGAFMIPTAVIAAGGAFTDDDTSVFEANIEWLADSGVTKGCNPPDNTRFCPDDNVTRGQMAAFMQRFAQYLDAEDGTPAQADNATSAETLDGQDPAAFVTSIFGSSCDSTCSDLSATNVELLELAIEAPADGYLQVSGTVMAGFTGPVNDYASMWFTLNGDATSFDGCETSFAGIPLGGNSLSNLWAWFWVDGNVDYAPISVTGVVPAPEGSHILRLCGYSNENADLINASVTGIWSASGSATVAAVGPVEVTAELEAQVADAQD